MRECVYAVSRLPMFSSTHLPHKPLACLLDIYYTRQRPWCQENLQQKGPEKRLTAPPPDQPHERRPAGGARYPPELLSNRASPFWCVAKKSAFMVLWPGCRSSRCQSGRKRNCPPHGLFQYQSTDRQLSLPAEPGCLWPLQRHRHTGSC